MGCPFSLTFLGARSGESASTSLSLPPFLDFFEADWPCPIARFWGGAWGEPGAGWDLLLPERREVITERMVGASLDMFPFRWPSLIDVEVKAACDQREATFESPLCDKFWRLVTLGAGHALQSFRYDKQIPIFNSHAHHCKAEWMYGVHSMEQQLELGEGLGRGLALRDPQHVESNSF